VTRVQWKRVQEARYLDTEVKVWRVAQGEWYVTARFPDGSFASDPTRKSQRAARARAKEWAEHSAKFVRACPYCREGQRWDGPCGWCRARGWMTAAEYAADRAKAALRRG
jgi:hypothetical protein